MAEVMPVAEVKTHTYEVMFLLGQQQAALLGEALEAIMEIFRRADAELLAMTKWDERRLAFEIEKQKRGCYILAFVRCYGPGVPSIERDVQISEKIMRALIIKADHLTEEQIASHDHRDELMAEAKMRAERGAEQEAAASTVRLGAPPEAEKPDAPEAETPADGDAPASPEAEAQADTTAE